MTVCAEENLVTCKFLTQRFTVHGHNLPVQSETQLEQALESQFKWLKNVWVDADAPRQFTVKYGVSGDTYHVLGEEDQQTLNRLLIEKTLEFISWNPENTDIVFEDF